MLIRHRFHVRPAGLVLGALCLLVVPPAALAVCLEAFQFSPATNYVTGWNPPHIVTGDFNEDGITDLAVCNQYALFSGGVGSNISILRGRGDGTFDPAVNFPAGSMPRSIVTGDFNLDDITDLAVTNAGSNNVSILFGLGSGGVGNGAFAGPVNYPAGAAPFHIRTADFNGDGIADLVVSNNAASAVTVLLGQGSGGVGNGAFGGPTSYALNNLSTGIAIGDFDSDGILDLVATENYSGTIAMLRGNGSGGVGNGTFAPAVHIAAGPEPFFITVRDLDGDGISDLAVANTSFGGIALMRGNGSGGVGNGTFAPPSYVPSGNSAQATFADVDQDGISDLLVAVASAAPARIRLYRGQGTGLVGAAEFGDPTDYAVGGNPIQTVMGDFNGDGKLDCAVPNYYENTISVLLGSCTADPRAPGLTQVRDVPNDQGGRVFLTWTRSSLDVTGGPVTSYRVWRRIPAELSAGLTVSDAVSWAVAERIARPRVTAAGTSIEFWEALATLPAQRLQGYGYTAATTQDSLPGSNPYTAFFITALTSSIDVFYSSNVDSGYSVDNLAPHSPGSLVAQPVSAQAVALHWAPSAEPDLHGYRLYRGARPTFVPSAANLISAQSDTGFIDPDGAGYTYKLTAVDAHGNESPPAVAAYLQIPVSVGPGAPAFALHGVRPNPSPDGRLSVSFTLSGGAPARLEVLDTAGRQVAERWVSEAGPGSVAIARPGGLPAGVYLIRLRQGASVLQTKAVVLR